MSLSRPPHYLNWSLTPFIASSSSPGARSRCAIAIRGSSRARSSASRASPALGDTGPVVAQRRRVPRARGVLPGLADPRARVVVRRARTRSTRRSSRARLRAAVAAPRLDARRAATRCASCTANPTGCPGWSSTATATWSCVQLLSAGAERWRDVWAPALVRAHRRERASTSAPTSRCAALEGLAPRVGRARGRRSRGRCASTRTASPTKSTWSHGQKTGFYLDQRDNRALAGELAARSPTCSTPSATPGASRSRR